MNKEWRFIRLDGGSYSHDVFVLITRDIPRAVRFMNNRYKYPDDRNRCVTSEDFDVRGKIFYHQTCCPVIWIPCKPSSPKHHATLSHEIFHAVCVIMRWANIPLSTDSEEAYAHQLRHLEEQFYTRIKNN